jgi:hypothetical protein
MGDIVTYAQTVERVLTELSKDPNVFAGMTDRTSTLRMGMR